MKTTIKADKFMALITGASQCLAAPKDSKGVPFKGIVRLELVDGTLTATGTDSHVLAQGTLTGLDNNGTGTANLTPDTIKAIGQLLKPMKDKPVSITLGYDLLIAGDQVQVFRNLDLDSYPKVRQLFPQEFGGLDTGITFDPGVMAKACKVTAASINWRFNGPFKGAYGVSVDTYNIEWQLLVMPLRVA